VLRIGVDARLVDYAVGGIARYTTQLMEAMVHEEGDHALVGIRAARPKLGPADLVATESISVYTPPHHRLERFTLSWELRSARLDVLHSPDFIAPRPGPWKSVITVHDLAFLRMPRILTSQSRRYYGGVARAVREADAVIAVSHATASDLIELVGAAPEKISVVYEAPGTDLGPLPGEDAHTIVAERFGLSGPFVLFVGTLEPRKNLPTLIQAFSQLRKDFPVQLVLAGRNGWLSDDVFRTVREQALADGVVFIEDFGSAELRALYGAAEVLVLPSLYEGFGLPAVEAMACGTAVVVANTGALPEVVGDAGVLVRPDDPNDIAQGLGWVLGNPAFRATLIQRGIERAATFSWVRAAQETLAVYERVTAA
jgi:glycosyltransferase involved in cell wall biosynthesis